MPQGLKGKKIPPETLFKKPAFHIGFMAGAKKLFEPEIFYEEQWDQIDYERGFLFNTYLRLKGIKLGKLPKKLTSDLRNAINSAIRDGSIL